MNLKTRLSKLEATIDPNVCPVCGGRLPAVAKARTEVERLFAAYQEAGATSTDAMRFLREDAPFLMRRCGLLPIIPDGHCTGCGVSLKPDEEIARELLAQFTAALNGDAAAAWGQMRAHAPSFAALLAQ